MYGMDNELVKILFNPPPSVLDAAWNNLPSAIENDLKDQDSLKNLCMAIALAIKNLRQ